MRFVFHIGLHCTDGDAALKCLLKNRTLLSKEGVAIAQPGKFRPAVREAMISLKGTPAPPQVQRNLLESILDDESPECVVFSSDSFLCIPQKAVSGDVLYPSATERALWIRQLFPQSEVHICFAIRNIATFLPALHRRVRPDQVLSDFVSEVQATSLRWSDMTARLSSAVPDAKVSVWCNEDSPILWPEILARLTCQIAAPLPNLEEWTAFYAPFMSEGGVSRMRTYMRESPTNDANQVRRTIAAFLDRFAKPEAVEEEFQDPAWNGAVLAELTANYEEDIATIDAMDGVDLMLV